MTRSAPFALLTLLAIVAIPARADHLSQLRDAERIRATDKAKARAILDHVERTLSPGAEPLAAAQAQLLECTWADSPAPAYRAVELGLPLAIKARNVAMQAKLIACRAVALQYDGKPRQAEGDLARAASLARAAGDRNIEADALANLATLQYVRGAMADALTNLQSAYRLSERTGNDKLRLDTLSQMANVYADVNVAQYDRAIEYYRQLITEYEKRGQTYDVGDMLFNIGSTYETTGNFTAAELHYRRALAIFTNLKQPDDVALTKRALGSALMKQGREQESLQHFDAALAWFEAKHDGTNVAFVKQFRGVAYRRLGRYADALRDLDAARQHYESDRNVRFLEKNVDETALVYEKLGDWKNAYAFRTRHTALQQQLAASRRDELSSRLRVEFDAEKKEQENRALARENALRTAALEGARRNAKLQLAVIALTALLAIALAVLFWRQVVNTRRMRAMAMTDELTRLPNRRHILAALEIAFGEAKRSGQPAAVITFDIDRFKRINDTWGHPAGDEVLKIVARTCREALRPSDKLGRTGGEEFLVVLQTPATAQQVRDVAERMRVAVERADVTHIAAGLQVTISLGVWVTNNYDANAAMGAADELLYRAKESGRNRVEVATA